MQALKKIAFWAGIFLLVLIVGIIVAAVLGVLLSTLYIFLMLLAALMIIGAIFQIYSVFALIRTIIIVRDEIQPLMTSVQETMGIVKDTAKTASQAVTTVGATTQLASEFALGPGVRTVAAVVAGQQMLRIFFGKGRTRSRAEERRKRQMAAARGEN